MSSVKAEEMTCLITGISPMVNSVFLPSPNLERHSFTFNLKSYICFSIFCDFLIKSWNFCLTSLTDYSYFISIVFFFSMKSSSIFLRVAIWPLFKAVTFSLEFFILPYNTLKSSFRILVSYSLSWWMYLAESFSGSTLWVRCFIYPYVQFTQRIFL